MQEEMRDQMIKPGMAYSYSQIAVASFLGTVLAAAFLTSRNISEKYGHSYGWAFFVFFCIFHVSWVAMNPFYSRGLNTLIFLCETILILSINYVFSLNAGMRRSWFEVITWSVGFLVAWLFVILFVFG